MKIHAINKQRVDKNRTTYQFQIGNEIYVENGSKLNRNKLDPIRMGSFRIIRQISPTLFEVEISKKKRASNFFHSSKLTPFLQKSVLKERGIK